MRAAVLGSPAGHSLSPVLHRAAYADLDLDWTYTACDVGADELAGFLTGLDGTWAGLSLTMPLKRAVLPLLDWLTPQARAVQAVNTVVLSRGRRLGDNTDVPGMVAALAEAGCMAAATATVLGGGATAGSALAALARLGVRDPVVVLRRPEAAAELGEVADRHDQTLTVRSWAAPGDALAAPLVVSTVPGGAADGLAARLPPRPGLLFDVAYDPWPTALAAAWRHAGGVVLGGLDLLVHQAVLQVRLMTGRDVDRDRLVTVLRAAGESELERRH